MKTTLVNAANASNILNAVADKKIPVKVSYKIIKLSKGLETEKEFYKNELTKLAKEYAKQSEDGSFVIDEKTKSLTFDDVEKENAFWAKAGDLDTTEITVPDIKFTVEELEFLNITPRELASFMDFVEE